VIGERTKLASQQWSAWQLSATNYGAPCRICSRVEFTNSGFERGRVNYRILYFFHGRGLAILWHAITEEDVAPDIEIERCLRRKRAFESDPEGHTYSEEEGGLSWQEPKTR
jgi:hypothetical protein